MNNKCSLHVAKLMATLRLSHYHSLVRVYLGAKYSGADPAYCVAFRCRFIGIVITCWIILLHQSGYYYYCNNVTTIKVPNCATLTFLNIQ